MAQTHHIHTRLVSGAFLIENVYDARRHRTRLPHLGKLLLRTCALAPLVCIIPRYLPRTLPEHVHLTRHDPPLLNFPPTLPPQAGILKAGAVGIEFSLKAKHALVLVNAETAQQSAPWLGSVCACVCVCVCVCVCHCDLSLSLCVCLFNKFWRKS